MKMAPIPDNVYICRLNYVDYYVFVCLFVCLFVFVLFCLKGGGAI